MTRARKIALVERVRGEFGLSPALRALDLAPSTWHYQSKRKTYATKYAALKKPLFAIADELPEYGYRRATEELSEKIGRPINRKVVQRLNQIWDLTVFRGAPAPRPSGIRQLITEAGDRINLVAGLDAIEPFQVVYTDFTELVYARGKAWLIPILGHVTKVVFGWALGPSADTWLALRAWKRATAGLRRLGLSPAGVIVHHDQDPVFTSYEWAKQLLLRDEVRISYALRGAKDNPEMEAFNSRFKCENRSLFADARSPSELEATVRDRMNHYNRRRRHSALGNQAPLTYAKSLSLSR
jgi:transposase InsO family protein